MSATQPYDLVVIGGGPAGYAAAIRAGQLGKKVACVELERAGGTCLNWGCIPSKALLKSAELYTAAQHSEEFGFTCGEIKVDFSQVIKRSRKVADTMGGGIEFLFKKNKVDYVVGRGQVNVPGMVEVIDGPDKGKYLNAKNILLATGCRARTLPGLEPDGVRVMTSREALAMESMPKSIVIMGAGAIGVEFAYFLNAFGCDVTLVEMMDRIVPVEDAEVSAALARAFKKQKISVHTSTKVEDIELAKNSVSMNLVKGEKSEKKEVEAVLLAIGVEAYTEGLLSPKVKPKTDRGYVVVDDNYKTSVDGIYAAGDLIGPPWLAHVATWEALQAVNGIFGHSVPERVKEFPGCTYCLPQVASIGLTEEKAKEQGLAYKVGKFPFSASGKAVAVNHPEGFVKLIVGEKYGEILGAHIIGHDATELIAEFGLGMKLEATADEIHATIHAHPTLGEAMGEAAAAIHGEAIHI